MRTTLDIDDDLLAALLARYPGRSKTEAIEIAIREHVSRSAYAELAGLGGAIDIDEDAVRRLRAADRTT